MAIERFFLPSEKELQLLAKLSGPLSLKVPQESTAQPIVATLIGDSAAITVTANYEDVVYKFECFYLSISTADPAVSGNQVSIGEIDHWQELRCAFRFEWERPALHDEVSPTYEQIVREYGPRKDVPENALALSATFCGIIFWNDDENTPVCFVECDAEIQPGSLSISFNGQDILDRISKFEVIKLGNILHWLDSVRPATER